VTAERCAEVLARILLDDTERASVALRAVELFFRLTTGFAPTRMPVFKEKAAAGKLFDATPKDASAGAAPIRTSKDDEPIAIASADLRRTRLV